MMTSPPNINTTPSPSIQNNNEREAKFLASQQARLDALHSNHLVDKHNSSDKTVLHNNDDNQEENVQQQRKQFWIIFKQECTLLHSELESLLYSSNVNVNDAIGSNSKHDENIEMMTNLNEKQKNKKQILYITAQQRNSALETLQIIHGKIRALHHYTLSNSIQLNQPSSSTSSSSLLLHQESWIHLLNPDFYNLSSTKTMPSLPVADLRLITTELQALKDKLDYIQNFIIPKEKFRFKRYHAAILERQNHHDNHLHTDTTTTTTIHNAMNHFGSNTIDSSQSDNKTAATTTTTTTITSNKNSHDELLDGITLENIPENSKVIVHACGKVSITTSLNHNGSSSSSANEEKNVNEEYYLSNQQSNINNLNNNASKAFLIRNLKCCQVYLNGTYDSLHIINTTDCSIHISKHPILGPVHVTNCHNTMIYIAFSRQLRIHDCCNVSFFIHVASGPIIENCTQMKFYQRNYRCDSSNTVDILTVEEETITQSDLDTKDNESEQAFNNRNIEKITNLYWDVKDFNWLRNLRKSPNFDTYSIDDQDNVDGNDGMNDTGVSTDKDGIDMDQNVCNDSGCEHDNRNNEESSDDEL